MTILSLHPILVHSVRKFYIVAYISGLFLVMLIATIHPSSLFKSKVNKEVEFNNNFARYRENGELLKNISSKNDKLFIDYTDSLIYYYSGLKPAYKYALYYPISNLSEIYSSKRMNMFQNTPPEFYYYHCSDSLSNNKASPKSIFDKYVNFESRNEGTCISIRKDTFKKISKVKLEELTKKNYTIVAY